MQADDLILFAQVIEMGSFSKVAEANKLTNSVVSKRIARLEADLGVPLLYRTTRKLTVTEAGKELARAAKNVQLATNEAANALSGFGEEISGHIKMSVPTISGDLLLADAVAEFCNLHPKLSVDMSLENQFVDLIDGGYDLVIRTGHLEDSSLLARHIIDSQWVVCASSAYIKQHGTPTSPNDLKNHNCLKYSYQSSGASEWQFKDGETRYFVNISGSFSTNNATALRKAILGGHGIGYVPRCLVYPDMCKGELVELFPQQVAKKQGVYAVYPFTKHPPKKIQLLIEHIKARYLSMSHYFASDANQLNHCNY